MRTLKRKPTITLSNARVEHAEQIYQMTLNAYEYGPDDTVDDVLPPDSLRNHILRFNEGQFVALDGEKVVGYAITMRTRHKPSDKPETWFEAIGGLYMNKHNPNGEWLYGVDFAVHPEYRRQGIGTRLYRARFNMVRRLNLRGFYAGGMLAGYAKYADRMTVQEYGEKVIKGDIQDPTVTMQINRGFKPRAVIKNYCGQVTEDDSAMLIVWNNPQYQAGYQLKGSYA